MFMPKKVKVTQAEHSEFLRVLENNPLTVRPKLQHVETCWGSQKMRNRPKQVWKECSEDLSNGLQMAAILSSATGPKKVNNGFLPWNIHFS